MYIAFCIMLSGMVIGRVLGECGATRLLRRCILPSIMLLLFLLGAEIGANRELLDNLPVLGGRAAWLMFCGVAGSVLMAALLHFLLRGKNPGEKGQ